MDIYSEDVEYLKKNPAKIKEHWNMWSPLFRTADGKDTYGSSIGCLTQIKLYSRTTGFPEFDAKLNADNNIPMESEDITVDQLESFAEYQRELDKLFPRKEITEYIPTDYHK